MGSRSVGFSLLILSMGLLIGKTIRVKVRQVQRPFLPSSIVGGVTLLVLGPQVLRRIPGPWGKTNLLTQTMVTTWSALPGPSINVVFATMFLSQDLPGPKRAAKLVGPRLALGTAFASSQYVVGLLLAALIIVPFFGSSPMTGGLIEIDSEGSRGTAADMRDVMTKLEFNEGTDPAVGITMAGLVSGIIVDIAPTNWGVYNGKTEVLKNNVQFPIDEQRGLFRRDEYYSARKMANRSASVEPLSLHIVIMALTVLIGWLILEGLRWIEHAIYASIMIGENTPLEILSYVPLLPMALIGGVILQLIVKALDISHVIDPQMMLRIQGQALNFLVISAIATVPIRAIRENLGAFLVLSVGGIVINLVLFLWLMPCVIGRFWFERDIDGLGQSMGVTVTGVTLMHITDPDTSSPAFEAFGYRQLIFEPFFGGGLVTVMAIPIIYLTDVWPLFFVMLIVFIVVVLAGLFHFGPKEQRDREAWLTRQAQDQDLPTWILAPSPVSHSDTAPE